MKKQSGFTLIELLLVLAIIGIISAIAIPALLSQRARARDKAGIDNMVGRVGDLVGQYDKFKEAGLGSGAITTSLQNYVNATGGADKNPWDAAAQAFKATIDTAGTATTQSGAIAHGRGLVSAAARGQVAFGVIYPAAGTPGFMIGAVYVDNKVNGSNTVVKATAIE
jgi:prepilin-type N-terminal cleavage/methylation domain-containing protein